MRVLLFSDLHGHAFKSYATMTPEGRNSRLQHTINIVEEIRAVAVAQECSGVLFGGDLFHIRPGVGSMRIPTFNALFDAIARLKISLDFVGLLVGNHDQGDRAGNEHSIYAFRSIVTVMDTPGWYEFVDNEDEMLQVLALPAHPDKGYLVNAVNEGVEERPLGEDGIPRVLLGHLGIDGAVVGTNFVLRDEHNLSVKDLRPDQFDEVFLGDYHQPQKLAKNVRYIGATHHHNWGDANSERGCLVWDTKTTSVTKIDLHSAPKFVSIPLHILEENANPPDVQGNYVRITHEKPLTVEKMERWKGLLKVSGCLNEPEFWLDPKAKAQFGREDTAKEFHPTMDYEEMISTYVNKEIPDSLDEEYLHSVGIEIMSKAMEEYEG